MKTYDLNLLRTLDAVLATGSVTAAAERLHLSVPATSHALRRLREVFRDPILVRAGRRLAPTPRALELKEPVAQWLAQAHALVAPPSLHDLAAAKRSFVLRAPDGFAVSFGAALASALHATMPQATLHIVPEAHGDTRALRDGRVDLDIGRFRARDPELEVVELGRQAQVGAVRADHPLARGRRTAKRYAEQRHVVTMDRPNEPSPVDAALAELGLSRFVALTVPIAYAALAVAARSDLVATVAQRLARALAPGLGLVVFELPFETAAEPTVMAWHPRHTQEPAHVWLRQLVRRVLDDAARRPATLEPLAPLKGSARGP
jgi:DNA-binding transcriptional LysR family regulator